MVEKTDQATVEMDRFLIRCDQLKVLVLKFEAKVSTTVDPTTPPIVDLLKFQLMSLE